MHRLFWLKKTWYWELFLWLQTLVSWHVWVQSETLLKSLLIPYWRHMWDYGGIFLRRREKQWLIQIFAYLFAYHLSFIFPFNFICLIPPASSCHLSQLSLLITSSLFLSHFPLLLSAYFGFPSARARMINEGEKLEWVVRGNLGVGPMIF